MTGDDPEQPSPVPPAPAHERDQPALPDPDAGQAFYAGVDPGGLVCLQGHVRRDGYPPDPVPGIRFVELMPDQYHWLHAYAGQATWSEPAADGGGGLVAGPGFAVPPAVRAARVRVERARRLADCDWTQLPDGAMSDTMRQAWRDYRSALRGVPLQPGFPEEVAWPEPPA